MWQLQGKRAGEACHKGEEMITIGLFAFSFVLLVGAALLAAKG